MIGRSSLVLLAAGFGCAGLGPGVEDAPPVEAPPSAAPAPPPSPAASGLLPLAVGNRWRWEIWERTGAGARIVGFPTEKATDVKLADWTLTIEDREGDGFRARLDRIPAGEGLPSSTALELWEDGGQTWMDAGSGPRLAVEAELPPTPVSAERVACSLAVLDGAIGTCPPLPGGPLGTRPGLEHGVVGGNERQGAEVAQVLVGVATLGIFIPGNRSTVQTASLVDFVPGPGHEGLAAATRDPLFEGFRAHAGGPDPAPRLRAGIAAQGGAPEAVAACLTLVDADRVVDVAAAVLPDLAPAARYPVARVALQRGARAPLPALATLRPALPAEAPDPEVESLLALLGEGDDRRTGELLLRSPTAFLLALLQAAQGPFDSDVLDALRATVATHPVHPEDVEPALRLCDFDDCRVEAAALLVARLDAADRAGAVEVALGLLDFDEGRLALLTRHADLLRTLPEPDRARLASEVTFERDRAREILGLPGGS